MRVTSALKYNTIFNGKYVIYLLFKPPIWSASYHNQMKKMIIFFFNYIWILTVFKLESI